MTVLLKVPVEDGVDLLVESDPSELPDDLVLASPGERIIRSATSLAQALRQIQPVLRVIKAHLLTAAPDQLSVEFGLKLGGETGIILTKGTTEVNFKVTMVWKREAPETTGADAKP
ncbi:CU044_2847 family protein [Dactylosporangium sp. CA-092794]|uniref:CU044_2847 family protein n=1 Tax=Dactylosporangium sp. CA-092794 TaxID=3239929 RepID=UPI003D8A0E6C